MLRQAQKKPSLPTNRAFVLQLQETARLNPGDLKSPGDFVGRIEHVVSGQSTRFHSLAELLAFIEQILNQLSDTSSKETSRRQC